MKKVATFLLLPVLLLGVFTIMPTGLSSSDVLSVYSGTTTFARSSSAYVLYLSKFQAAADGDFDNQFSASIGQRIASFATALCEDFGNGGNIKYSEDIGRHAGQFRYSTTLTEDYNTPDVLKSNILSMASDSSKTTYISCCAFATFCWEVMLTGKSPYGTGCTTTVKQNFKDIIEGDGTSEYIIENAKPGDLLFYAKTDVADLATNAVPSYAHAEIYIGQYTGVDAQGTSYTIEYACAGSNQPTKRRDACIKPLSSTVSGSHPYVYLVALSKWIESGNEPINNSDQVELVEDILEGVD